MWNMERIVFTVSNIELKMETSFYMWHYSGNAHVIKNVALALKELRSNEHDLNIFLIASNSYIHEFLFLA